MNRQRAEVRGGGAQYSTELAGRDRFKFFRRPVEPSGGELHAGGGGGGGGSADAKAGTWSNANVHYADVAPAAATSSVPLGGASAISIPSNSRYRPRPSSVELPNVGRGNPSRARRRLDSGRGSRPRTHHLPTLGRATSEAAAGTTTTTTTNTSARGSNPSTGGTGCDAGVQTVYRENEAQTDPYSPDYFIPDGVPEPEVVKLSGLTVQNGGLPAGREELALIERLRRRREVEAGLPEGNDDASLEARFRTLHELEEQEWKEREQHVSALQQRRHDRIAASLLEREAAREAANRERLEAIKQQYLAALEGRLSSMQARSLADSRRAMDRRMARNRDGGVGSAAAAAAPGTSAATAGAGAGGPGSRGDLIESYVNYGSHAAPPSTSGECGAGAGAAPRASTRAMTYDVRPALLTDVEGVREVEEARGGGIARMPAGAFRAPENEATARLPTLHQRHEAERVVQSLERAQAQIDAAKSTAARSAVASNTVASAAETGGALLQEVVEEVTRPRSVLDLYRAPPKVQRPNTPELELDGDAQEEEEEACILLQRLLRGRAVQNDFFEGKERCRGLIQELQAASDAKEAERAVADVKELEALAEQQSNMVAHVLGAAVGDIISDTLGYLYQEKERRADARRLEALRAEAEAVRQSREAVELARRDEERRQRDREGVQYAALVRATTSTATAFIEQLCAQAVRDTAVAVAVEAERARQAALPAPRDPCGESVEAEVAKEDLVCDMLDGFVIPAIVDSVELLDRRLDREAPGGAAGAVGREVVRYAGRQVGGSA